MTNSNLILDRVLMKRANRCPQAERPGNFLGMRTRIARRPDVAFIAETALTHTRRHRHYITASGYRGGWRADALRSELLRRGPRGRRFHPSTAQSEQKQ